ncbi:MAG: DUF5005 domain-containing protein [bacterium]
MYIKNLILLVLILAAEISLAVDPDTVFNNQFRRDIGGWIAADATYSIYLPDGRTLWLFGDTFIGEVNEDNSIVPGSKFIRNSAVIQDGDDLQTLFGGTRAVPADYIPTPNPDSTWYWPEHGIVEDDTLRIFVAKFRKDPDGPPGFQFAHAGNDIANFSFPGLEFINSVEITASAVNDVLYGDRIMDDSLYVYIYGRRNDDPEINIAYPHVARAGKGEVMDQNWEYFTGKGWSSNPDGTKRINSFQVSQQYSVTKFMGKYILLTQDIWTSPKIFTFTSDSPTGPWENKRLIYETPEREGDTWTYNAYAHPQFNEKGELLVSYNVNGDFFSIFDNVEIYRPRFIRVPYMNIDFAFWSTGSSGIWNSGNSAMRIFPNPVKKALNISLKIDRAINTRLEIIDISGIVVHTGNINLAPGTNQFNIPVEKLPAGMYFCRVRLENHIETVKFIKNIKTID